MGSCEFVTLISTLACTIAKNKSQKEIELLAVFFYTAWRYFSHYFSYRLLSL